MLGSVVKFEKIEATTTLPTTIKIKNTYTLNMKNVAYQGVYPLAGFQNFHPFLSRASADYFAKTYF